VLAKWTSAGVAAIGAASAAKARRSPSIETTMTATENHSSVKQVFPADWLFMASVSVF
jgi:hypothetical protein